MLLGQRTQGVQELRVHRRIPHARARRLQDHRGDVVVGLQGALDLLRVVGRDHVRQRGHLGRDAAHVAASARQQQVVPAVEMVREPQDVGLAGVSSRQTKGKHRRFRAGRREPHALRRGHKPLHQSRPLDLLTVAGAEVRPLLQRIGYRLNHLRPPMAEQQGAVAHDVVNVLVAVDVPLAAAVGVSYDNGERHHVAGVVGHPIGEETHSVDVCRRGPLVVLRVLFLDRWHAVPPRWSSMMPTWPDVGIALCYHAVTEIRLG